MAQKPRLKRTGFWFQNTGKSSMLYNSIPFLYMRNTLNIKSATPPHFGWFLYFCPKNQKFKIMAISTKTMKYLMAIRHRNKYRITMESNPPLPNLQAVGSYPYTIISLCSISLQKIILTENILIQRIILTENILIDDILQYYFFMYISPI